MNPKLAVANVTNYPLFSLESHLVTLTLLIDLDDTLLSNDMDTFIPAYLSALGNHLESHIDTRQLAPVMINATKNMFQNTRLDRTLKESFDPDFYPKFGITENQVSDTIERFYADVFPTLQCTTKIRPEAVKLIDEAFERGWEIAIATNPLFPLAAILHRLDWAGLPPEKYPFAIIPSYETFHFAKPNPAFFAELLGWFGWPRRPVVMVGNDPDHDIRGANLMGIATFWISNGLPYPQDFPAPSASGVLEDIIPWLDSTSEDQLQPDYGSPEAIEATLRGIPSALLGITSNLLTDAWIQRPENDEWCLTEITCHLRDVEREVNLPRLEKIIREDTPFIPGIDTDAWAEERDYRSQDGVEALRDFVVTRQETLALMTNLSDPDWKSPAQHAIFGPTDLREIASIIAGHDRLHIRQAHAML
jgi:FMN phosphatase YigB (HAD superfamily)